LIDLLRQGVLHLNGVENVVLDEADEMLDLGFLPDVETLLSRIPADRHMMLFSATMPGPVITLARKFMTQPTHIRAQDPDDQGQTVNTVQQAMRVPGHARPRTVGHGRGRGKGKPEALRGLRRRAALPPEPEPEPEPEKR